MALAAMLVCVRGASAAGQDPLRGQWHLDEICDNPCDFHDSSGNGLTAHGTGGPGSGPSHVSDGRFGGALRFPTKTDWLNAGNFSLLQPPHVTLVAWVRKSSTPGTVEIVANQGASGGCSHASYALYTGGSADVAGLRFYIWNGTQIAVSPAAANTMWDGNWHMAAGTYDGTTVRLYLDGTEVGSGTPASGNIGYGLAASNDFIIGGTVDSSCIENTNFSGDVDETRVYSRALTGSEIATLANSAATSPPELPPDSTGAPPGGATGGAAPPGGGQPAPPPSFTRPSASFLLSSGKVRPFAPETFDASSSSGGSSQIKRFDWDLNGDGRTDVSCSGHDPVFTTNTLRASTRSIGLQVVADNGLTAKTTQNISVPKLSLSPALVRALVSTHVRPDRLSGAPYVGGMCSPKDLVAAQSVDDTDNGGPGPGCISELVYGNFKAVGCWRRVDDPSKLPQSTGVTVDKALRPDLFGFGSPITTTAGVRRVPFGQLLRSSHLPPFVSGSSVHASASLAQFALVEAAIVASSTYVADGPVRVNGLDVYPLIRGGARSTIGFVGGGLLNEAKSRLVSTGGEVVGSSPFGQLVMKRGELQQAFGLSDVDSPFGALNIPGKLPLVPGLGIEGDISATMNNGALKLGANVSLPGLLGGVTANADLEATNEHGVELDHFQFSAAEAPIGPLILKNMNFEWDGPTKRLTAGLEATILYQVGAGGTIVFEHGDFRSLNVFAEAFPGVVLAPGVNLTEVDAAFDTNGPVIAGGGTLTLGPNPGGGCPKIGVVGHMKLDLNWPITLSTDGATKLLCFSVAKMEASINEYGYGSFLGRFNPDLSPLPLTIDASAGGQIQVPIEGRQLAFQLDMHAQGCLDLGTIFGKHVEGCVGGDFTASDKALGFCGDFGWIDAGIRLYYPPPESLLNPVAFVAAVIANSKVLAPDCDLGPYRTLPALASAAATNSAAFDMPAGGKDSLVAFHGAGGPPDLVLHGPGGRTIDVPSIGWVHNDSYVAFRLPYDRTTYVIIRHPQAGRWTVERKPGSPDISSIQLSTKLPPVRIRARVRKVGSRRELRYRVNTRPGQSVRFVEVAGRHAGQFLATTTKASGRIRFTPADSATRQHMIIAYVSQDGAPRKTVIVARFQAVRPRIGRAGTLRARRRRRTLVITWSPAANAQRYRVFVGLSDGRTLFFTSRARKRRLVVGGVKRRTSGLVTVIGERVGGRLGPKVRIKIRAG